MFNVNSPCNDYIFLCGEKCIVGKLVAKEGDCFGITHARNILHWKSSPALRRLATDGTTPSENTRVGKLTLGASMEYIFSHSIDQIFKCTSAGMSKINDLSFYSASTNPQADAEGPSDRDEQ